MSKENFPFVEGRTKEFEVAINEAMVPAIKHFEKDLASIRTGRASPAMLDDVRVECYGQLMPLKDLATIAAPDARLLTIQPWDKGAMGAIEKALLASDIGITPTNDGNLIRLQLPQMSGERREELVKKLGKKTEECRVAIRNVRRDFHNLIREAQKDHTVSEDFAHKLTEVLQKITDAFIAKADELQTKKESDLHHI